MFKILKLAREKKIPVVFTMTKFQLGMLALKTGFNAAIIGVLDIHGVIPEVRELEEMVDLQRQKFYEETKGLHEIVKKFER